MSCVHAAFARVGGGVAGAEAAVVDGEDVEAGGVEAGEGGEGVGERAGAAVEIEDGEGGVPELELERVLARGWVGRWAAGGGVPPAGERGGRFWRRRSESRRRPGCGGGPGDGAVWVEDELPLALVDQPACGEPGAEVRDEQGKGKGFEEPEGVDDLDGGGAFGRGIL